MFLGLKAARHDSTEIQLASDRVSLLPDNSCFLPACHLLLLCVRPLLYVCNQLGACHSWPNTAADEAFHIWHLRALLSKIGFLMTAMGFRLSWISHLTGWKCLHGYLSVPAFPWLGISLSSIQNFWRLPALATLLHRKSLIDRPWIGVQTLSKRVSMLCSHYNTSRLHLTRAIGSPLSAIHFLLIATLSPC